uniref:beta-N-acetylhexosaminidase n=1 Tax=Glossina brevipalpis TaxID=37001 RepID=A0A1A9WWM6_9MUSC
MSMCQRLVNNFVKRNGISARVSSACCILIELIFVLMHRCEEFFEIRHGLETLSQLWHQLAFKLRGLLLDKDRNFYNLEAIKGTLSTTNSLKLNKFGWHIIDSQSFPMEVKAQPDLHKICAYSQRKVYTHEGII